MNMNPSAVEFCLRDIVRDAVPRVFETMLSLPVAPLPAAPSARAERVSGTIGIGGERVSGAIFVHFPEALAGHVTAAMIGGASAADSSAQNDVVCELTNMIGGAIKSALCDATWPCAMSTPSVIRGMAFSVELPPGAVAEKFFFDCKGECLALEIQLKLG